MRALTELSERAQIEAVFCLGGGELEYTLLRWRRPYDRTLYYHQCWWYDGVPEYVPSSEAPMYSDIPCRHCDPEMGCRGWYEYRTLIRCELWRQLSRADLPPGWEVWGRYSSSGECEHPGYAPGECDERDPERWVYLGDGWHEVVIRRLVDCANYDESDGFEELSQDDTEEV